MTHVRSTEQTPDSTYAGQSGLMALWDKLFTMLGVGSAQLLVSPDDFADEETSKNLQVCVEAILSMGAVPILNENPAASTSFSEVRCKPSLQVLSGTQRAQWGPAVATL